jgi:hypothetical protein
MKQDRVASLSTDPPLIFTQLAPLGRFGPVVAMSVLILSPSHEMFCEASYWPSDDMVSSRPLIGHLISYLMNE